MKLLENLQFIKKLLCLGMAFVFAVTSIGPSYAQSVVDLPKAGTMVNLSQGFAPVVLRGMKVDPNDPFKFEFVLDPGQSGLQGDALKDESTKLIRYFLASVTTPEKDLWVNLSPYEQDRIIPEAFGMTEMGRDLLSQDYILKQVTSSLMYPEGETGKVFWAKVYAQAYDKFGTTDVPVDTFNKVWITPDMAEVYEDNGVAFIGESHLKVMLESDYLAELKTTSSMAEPVALEGPAFGGQGNPFGPGARKAPGGLRDDLSGVARQIVREVMLPVIEKEVNEGKNFAQLRQVYQSLILAAWYKKRLKDSVLSKVYADRNKVAGVDITDKKEGEKIWAQYVEAFKKGAYNYIKEEVDQYTDELIPRKYFSGGCKLGLVYKMIRYFSLDRLKYGAKRFIQTGLLIAGFVIMAANASGQMTAPSSQDDGGKTKYNVPRNAKWTNATVPDWARLSFVGLDDQVNVDHPSAGKVVNIFNASFMAGKKIFESKTGFSVVPADGRFWVMRGLDGSSLGMEGYYVLHGAGGKELGMVRVVQDYDRFWDASVKGKRMKWYLLNKDGSNGPEINPADPGASFFTSTHDEHGFMAALVTYENNGWSLTDSSRALLEDPLFQDVERELILENNGFQLKLLIHWGKKDGQPVFFIRLTNGPLMFSYKEGKSAIAQQLGVLAAKASLPFVAAGGAFVDFGRATFSSVLRTDQEDIWHVTGPALKKILDRKMKSSTRDNKFWANTSDEVPSIDSDKINELLRHYVLGDDDIRKIEAYMDENKISPDYLEAFRLLLNKGDFRKFLVYDGDFPDYFATFINFTGDGTQGAEVLKEVELMVKALNPDADGGVEKAQTVDNSEQKTYGGIDLNTGKLKLNIKGDGSVAIRAFDPAMITQFEAAPGLIPVMINIRPVDDLPAFLGVPATGGGT